jgi:hypothetical protein
MLKTFVLRLELFAGSDIATVAREMCELANRIGVRCEASFNDVKLWARPGDDPQLLVAAYWSVLGGSSSIKIAQAH